jgi:hypothetical protein
VSDPHDHTVNFDHAQTGDVHSRDAAGRDVLHSVAGLTGADVQRILADQQASTDRLVSLVRDIFNQQIEDSRDRIARQRLADEVAVRLDVRMTRIEFGLIAMLLLWIIGMIFLIWLLVDRYAVETAARVAAGAIAMFTLWRVTH